MSVTLATIQKFAPQVHLHPYDNHRPISVDEYLTRVDLVGYPNFLLTETVTLDSLVKENYGSTFMRFKKSLPTAADDYATGAAIVDGKCNVQTYVKVFEENGYIDIIYMFLYQFNGFQPFRVGILDGVYTKKRNFCWARFARHEGDWEHVTVRVFKDGSAIIGVFLSQHDSNQYLQPNQLSYVSGTTHPIIYSAWNSHANYASVGVMKGERVAGPGTDLPAGLLPVKWLDSADVTTTDSLEYYRKPSPFFSTVTWNTWEHIVLVDGNTDANKWLSFQGNWGTPDLDNTHIDAPPDLPANAHRTLYDESKIAMALGMLDKYKTAGGPKSPAMQGYWRSKEKTLLYLQSQQYGGTKGSAFDDTVNLTLYQTVQRIVIRTGGRVDNVGLDLSDGSILRHGGSGGIEQSLSLDADDQIIKVELSLGLFDGSDRLSWVKFTTLRGKSIEGGSPTDNYRTIDVPPSCVPIGFAGRSGTEVDRLGLLMRATNSEQQFFQSAQYGGTGGTAFDDGQHATLFQWPTLVWIRAASRVDQVGMSFSDGSPVKHGGTGGEEQQLELSEEDKIVTLEMSLGEYNDSTRLFWIRFTTAQGHVLEGGKRTSSYHVIHVPDTMVVVGFTGRSGSAIDKLGLALRIAPAMLRTP